MPTQHEEMLKRLDGMAENIAISMSGKTISSHEHYIEQLKKTILKELEPFLISEIDLAVANREKEIVEEIKSLLRARMADPLILRKDIEIYERIINLISKNK